MDRDLNIVDTQRSDANHSRKRRLSRIEIAYRSVQINRRRKIRLVTTSSGRARRGGVVHIEEHVPIEEQAPPADVDVPMEQQTTPPTNVEVPIEEQKPPVRVEVDVEASSSHYAADYHTKGSDDDGHLNDIRHGEQEEVHHEEQIHPEEQLPQEEEQLPEEQIHPVLLTCYATHRAKAIWDDKHWNDTIKVVKRLADIKKIRGWRRDVDDPDSWFGMARRSGLTELEDVDFSGVDHSLITAFVERWHPETNTFHMPWGEMGIALHDVQIIMGLVVDGDALLTPGDERSRLEWLVDTFGLSSQAVEQHRTQLYINPLMNIVHTMLGQRDASHSTIASSYLLFFLASALVVDKTTTRFRPWIIDLVRDHDMTSSYAWGTGILAFLYRQLGEASRVSVTTMGGCTTLLQFWIYAHFPSLGCAAVEDVGMHGHTRWCSRLSVPKTPTISILRVRALRAQLDQMRAEDVRFMPYDQVLDFGGEHAISRYRGIIRISDIEEPYMPDRFLRQFGYVQTVPLHRIPLIHESRSAKARPYRLIYASEHDRWASRHLEETRVSFDGLVQASSPWLVDDAYMTWYIDRGHPYVLASSAVVDPPIYRPPPIPVSDTRRLHIMIGRARDIVAHGPPYTTNELLFMIDEATRHQAPVAPSHVQASQHH